MVGLVWKVAPELTYPGGQPNQGQDVEKQLAGALCGEEVEMPIQEIYRPGYGVKVMSTSKRLEGSSGGSEPAELHKCKT
eukprot:8752248-Ditylum_brightwellii.AAC.1